MELLNLYWQPAVEWMLKVKNNNLNSTRSLCTWSVINLYLYCCVFMQFYNLQFAERLWLMMTEECAVSWVWVRFGNDLFWKSLTQNRLKQRFSIDTSFQRHKYNFIKILKENITIDNISISSVSIVSDYWLDDRGSIPDRSKGFFF
jgi:hypothetical protein